MHQHSLPASVKEVMAEEFSYFKLRHSVSEAPHGCQQGFTVRIECASECTLTRVMENLKSENGVQVLNLKKL